MERSAIHSAHLTEESDLVRKLVDSTTIDRAMRSAISAQAAELVRQVRSADKVGIMEQILAEYNLSSEEGVALMCLAEAMLRVPDSLTVDELIQDKITPHNWASHVGDSGSILVNASTWGLLLTGRVLDDTGNGVVGMLHDLLRRLGEPVIRKAVSQAMVEMGNQFVLGQTIEQAMHRGNAMVKNGYSYSYDMLGEAARTESDAKRYHDAYAKAIQAISTHADKDDVRENPGISVKLSALHSRYEPGQRERVVPLVAARLLELAQVAKIADIGFNIDAEEADRLDLSLDVIETVLSDESLQGWAGFGVVVQAFGRRAMPVLDWLYDLSQNLDQKIMVRLVKGAYWDMEIKRAQVLGLSDYPVFTKKAHSDISYLACARKLLGMTDRIYPQFATHNAHSIAAVLAMAPDRQAFEFQRLHGMGETLHDLIKSSQGTQCRIYAPVGAHQDLLAYLVRRLLENGANSSFVNQIIDLSVSPEDIARDPIDSAAASAFCPNPAIPRPADLFLPRVNARGWDVTDPSELAVIESGRTPFSAPNQWAAGPISPVVRQNGAVRNISNPARPLEVVGTVAEINADDAITAINAAIYAQPKWARLEAARRAGILRKIADIYEANKNEILALTAREAGKTLFDGVAEIREAVDFLRYYANEEECYAGKKPARGVIVCISPWNFPLAIFTGQIAAALATGNAVIAKPAEQTPLIAYRAVQWMQEAGVPDGVIQLLPGDGLNIGGPLTADPRIAGVCFTGSTEVAKVIDKQLAATAPEAMLIAETGGMNAMIVDSTALLEQATRDIIRSAFQSAGQRCSALRILYVQKDIETELLEMLSGAMDALVVGDPWNIATDIAPVIDVQAQTQIRDYIKTKTATGQVLKSLPVPEEGLFIGPTLIHVSGIAEVEREIFGPVLHIASFESEDINTIVGDINDKGFGLTFGLHSRIDRRVQRILDQVRTGNAYVNRDQIGAVVGSQPFGGHGLSGTGPKAGGPQYLSRFRQTAYDALPVMPKIGGRIKNITTAVLDDLGDLDWAVAKDRIPRLRAALRGAAAEAMAAVAGLDFGPVDLPGPTGESNQFELHARGIVLCLGLNEQSLLSQCVQALAAGNAVLAVTPRASIVLRILLDNDFPIAAINGILDTELLKSLDVNLVALHANRSVIQPLRQALAAREGPIIPVITEIISPASYITERSICIDTTAAGGNASLLTKAEA